MRQERTVQATVFDIFAEHEIGRELSAISQWLDEQRWLLGLIAADLRGHGIKETGRHGLPAEAVLRCALLKQYRQLSYMERAFHLEDSASLHLRQHQRGCGTSREGTQHQGGHPKVDLKRDGRDRHRFQGDRDAGRHVTAHRGDPFGGSFHAVRVARRREEDRPAWCATTPAGWHPQGGKARTTDASREASTGSGSPGDPLHCFRSGPNWPALRYQSV
jgi:hypothetical protein